MEFADATKLDRKTRGWTGFGPGSSAHAFLGRRAAGDGGFVTQFVAVTVANVMLDSQRLWLSFENYVFCLRLLTWPFRH
jgi:hypothetical protein